jgi:uncharacterized delta-60 repeat protein
VKPSPKAVRALLFSTLFFLFFAWTAALPSASAQTIQVTSANPSSAAQGTVNLNVTISGSGFKKGAKSQWFVSGTTNPGGVTVNSTALNNSQQLTANITVAADATIAQFDIVVLNTDGRTGKGTELFAVQAKGSNATSCPVLKPQINTVMSCTNTLSGCLDSTFGMGGLVTTDTGGDYLSSAQHNDEGWVPLIQSDGKIVVAGYGQDPNSSITTNDFTVVRYNSDASLDTAFGSGGIARAVISTGNEVRAAALQSDGKIVVVGFGGFVAVRFNSDGMLDATFGAGGIVNIACSGNGKPHGNTSASGLAVQSDGKILVSGVLCGNTAVVRLNPDGTFDSSFGAGGEAIGGVASNALAIQNITIGTANQQFIVAGGGNFSLMRLTPSGTLDSTFGPNGNGQVTAGFCGTNDNAFAMNFDAAGRIVLAGFASLSSTVASSLPKFVVVRFTSNGILDTTFGDPISGSSSRTGKTAIAFLGGESIAWGVAGQTDGKIVVSGWAADPNTTTSFKTYFALARLNPDGSLDTTFGTGGVVATDFGLANNFGHALVIQPDGKIVVAGTAYPFPPPTVGNGAWFAVVRFWP